MPQIAQQDYISGLSITDYSEPTAEEKAAIRELVKRGTIWDAIIYVGSTNSRVVAVNEEAEYIYVFDSAEGGIVSVEYSED